MISLTLICRGVVECLITHHITNISLIQVVAIYNLDRGPYRQGPNATDLLANYPNPFTLASRTTYRDDTF